MAKKAVKKFFKKKPETLSNVTAKKEKPSAWHTLSTVPKKTEKKKRPQFPRISRFIPEPPQFTLSKPQIHMQVRQIILVILILLGVALNGFVGVMFFKTFLLWSDLLQERQKLYTQMQLWQNITKEYSNNRDAYFAGALFAYELGDKQMESYFLDKLTFLDPNFPLTTALEKLETIQKIGGKR